MSNVEKVLDKGYSEVVDVLGDDLTPGDFGILSRTVLKSLSLLAV